MIDTRQSDDAVFFPPGEQTEFVQLRAYHRQVAQKVWAQDQLG